LEKETAQLLAQAKARRTSEFEKFGQTYYHNPVEFARDCIKWKHGEFLTAYQEEILNDITDKRRICVRGAHGLGKSCTASVLILWFALTREATGVDFKICITASVGTQLRNFLWPEVKKWCKQLKWDKIGRPPFNPRNELLTLELILSNGRAFCVAPEEPAKLEGAHADSLLYVIDESKAVPDEIFDAAEGALSGAGGDTGREAYILTMSTPGNPIGRFYEIQKDREKYKAWHCRYVTTEEVLAAGRMSLDFMEQKKLEWGEDSAAYISRVLGRFCSSESNALIPMDWVEMAMMRGQEDEHIQALAQSSA